MVKIRYFEARMIHHCNVLVKFRRHYHHYKVLHFSSPINPPGIGKTSKLGIQPTQLMLWSDGEYAPPPCSISISYLVTRSLTLLFNTDSQIQTTQAGRFDSLSRLYPNVAASCDFVLSIRAGVDITVDLLDFNNDVAEMSTNTPLSPTYSLRDLHDQVGSTSQPHDQYGGPEDPPTASELHPGGVHTSPPHDNPINSAPSDTSSSQHARNSFQPFFTLVEDAHTSDYHHPTVHYIFSDDDTDIVTEAALRSLEGAHVHKEDPKSDDSEKSALLPPPVPGVRENYIVLDVERVPSTIPNPDLNPAIANQNLGSIPNPGIGEKKTQSQSPGQSPGSNPQFRVTSAKSFSPGWQVLSSEMVAAPTFENGNGNPGDAGHGLMLKILGTGGLAGESGRERGTQRLEDMMDQFAKRMQELQMIIEAADIQDDQGVREEGDEANEYEEDEKEKEET